MRNPILIELTRGALVESAHAGVVAVARADGELVASGRQCGCADLPALGHQAAAGAAVRRDGRRASASASGRPRSPLPAARIRARRGMWRWSRALLATAGLTPAALGCGVHEPFDAAVARDMIRRGERPTSLHHNCSGKHAAMLATAAHLGEPTDGYWLPDHPVQVRIRRVLEDLTGCSLTPGGVRHRRLLGAELGDPAGGSRPRLRALRVRRQD